MPVRAPCLCREDERVNVSALVFRGAFHDHSVQEELAHESIRNYNGSLLMVLDLEVVLGLGVTLRVAVVPSISSQ